jgi:hypothetical protein
MAGMNARVALPLCPSALPGADGSVVFGVVGECAQGLRVDYLEQVVPVSESVLALAKNVEPTEIFRFGAPCAERACQHFDGADCRLARRIVRLLPAVGDGLPPCQLRPDCRWWQQEGKAACLRCPQIVSATYGPSDLLRLVASPSADEMPSKAKASVGIS